MVWILGANAEAKPKITKKIIRKAITKPKLEPEDAPRELVEDVIIHGSPHRLESPSSSLQITEVYYLTEGKDRQWVELQNQSSKSIDLKGWTISNGGNLRAPLAESSLIIPSKEFVLIQFQGSGQTDKIKPNAKATLLRLVPEQTGDVLGRWGGQIAIYEPARASGTDKRPVMRSFVAWGNSPSLLFGEAACMRLTKVSSLIAAATAAEGPNSMEAGGSFDGPLDKTKTYSNVMGHMSAYVALEALKKPLETMQITEVHRENQDGKRQWVKLQNCSPLKMDLKDWTIANGGNLYHAIANKPLVVKPGAKIFVVFQGSGSDDPNSINTGVPIVRLAAERKGDVLGEASGQLALYQPPGPKEWRPALRSFKAWGNSPALAEFNAVSMRLWFDFGSTVKNTHPDPAAGVGRSRMSGGTIGVDSDLGTEPSERIWRAFLEDETSGGAANQLNATLPHVAFTPSVSKDRKEISFQFVSERPTTRFQMQISKSRDFRQALVDTTSDHWSLNLKLTIPAGQTYYWRARLVQADRSYSKWTPIEPIYNPQY